MKSIIAKMFFVAIFMAVLLSSSARALSPSPESSVIPTSPPATSSASPLPSPTASPSENLTDKITSFDSNIFITHAGVAQITETIIYSNDSPHHGLERFIPTILTDVSSGQSYYFGFKLISAKDQNGKDYRLSRHDTISSVGLRLGDPDHTFSGAATYIIQYELWPVISRQNGFDFLNLNITGNDWRVPIMVSRARLSFENDINMSQITCYVGKVSATNQSCEQSQQGKVYNFASSQIIHPGEGMTVIAHLPSGSFSNYLTSGPIPPWWWLWPRISTWLIGTLLLIGALIIRLHKQLKYRSAKKSQTIIAQYEPPDGLKPAEVGLLLDNKAEMKEITATLIDLAIRRYIKIDQIKPKTWYAKAQYRFSLLKSELTGLENYEINLVNAIFSKAQVNEAGIKVIELKNIDQNSMAITISKIKEQLNSQLEGKGYYPVRRFGLSLFKKPFVKSEMVRGVLVVIFIIVGLLMLSYLFRFHILVALFLLAICWAITYVKRPTTAGLAEWAKIEGFKLFLTVTEKDRLEFSDAPAKNPKLF